MVRERVREAIADGALRPGERIDMDALVRAIEVSKIPVREAVKICSGVHSARSGLLSRSRSRSRSPSRRDSVAGVRNQPGDTEPKWSP
ncbi:GntR family transcriptional regulator [Streptomyces gardneri]|uniref:GntR family transcriptional regulator n=1 Tax=Streptomyces gardneri TaxID=66892 RepID=UPI0036AA8C93